MARKITPRQRLKIENYIQKLAVTLLDPLFLTRHPGPILLAIIRIFSPLVRKFQPNDRWSLPAFIPQWIRLLEQPTEPIEIKTKTIFIFCCYRGQFTHDIVMAILLAWRGHRIVFGYLPKLRSPIKDPLDDSSGATNYLHQVLDQVGKLSKGRVRCFDLTEHIKKGSVIDDNFLKKQVHADVVMKIRKEHLSMSNKEVQNAFKTYTNVARDAQSAASSWFKNSPDQCDLFLVANGASFEAAQFMHVAKAYEIPATSYEKFAFNRARTITHGSPFYSFDDLDVLLNNSSKIGLNNPITRRLVTSRAQLLLNERRTSSGSSWGWQYQKGTNPQKESELLNRLKIERNRFVLVCPNVPFDAGYGAWLTIFPSMRDWLEQSVRYLLANSSLDIVVRAHPAECRAGFDQEQVWKIFLEAGIESDRLKIISGDSDINTYDLMPSCLFGLVFASTTGIEIAMHGKPVLAGANVYYSRCGVTIPANSQTEYWNQLAKAASGQVARTSNDADHASVVYFLFHYNLQWPYPYDKPSHIVGLPPHMLRMSPSIKTYIKTLDVLAMNLNEFQNELPNIIDLNPNRWSNP